MFSFSCFSCISSKKTVLSLDISNIDQTIPIIKKDEPIIDVSNITNKNILYYFKILKKANEKEISNSRLEDSKSEYIAAEFDSDEDEDEICVILQNKPKEILSPKEILPSKEILPPKVCTPIHDESCELIKPPESI